MFLDCALVALFKAIFSKLVNIFLKKVVLFKLIWPWVYGFLVPKLQAVDPKAAAKFVTAKIKSVFFIVLLFYVVCFVVIALGITNRAFPLRRNK